MYSILCISTSAVSTLLLATLFTASSFGMHISDGLVCTVMLHHKCRLSVRFHRMYSICKSTHTRTNSRAVLHKFGVCFGAPVLVRCNAARRFRPLNRFTTTTCSLKSVDVLNRFLWRITTHLHFCALPCIAGNSSSVNTYSLLCIRPSAYGRKRSEFLTCAQSTTHRRRLLTHG